MGPRLSGNTGYVVEQNSVSDVRIDRTIVHGQIARGARF